jgi:exonuclease SbcD
VSLNGVVGGRSYGEVMRLLHTSDWHLGRSLHGVSLLGAQSLFLDSLVATVRSESIDLVVVAGDVYDRALPSVDTVHLLDEALDRLLDAGARVLMSSGNHDSAQRLGFGRRRAARAGLHLRCCPSAAGEPVLVGDRHGVVACYALPYLEPGLHHDALGVARSHQAVLGAAMAAVRADLAARAAPRSVVAAHAFIAGGQSSDSERDIRVGGVDRADTTLFDGVGYTALGHLHAPQTLSQTIRYCGSPLAYSFSEAGQAKGVWLVEYGARSVTRVEQVPAPATRPLVSLRGRLTDLLTDPRHAVAEDAYLHVTLTDAERPREPMQRLRARFPHTLVLGFEPQGVPPQLTGRTSPPRSDEDLCWAFLAEVRGHAESPEERRFIQQALEAGRFVEAGR